MSSGMEPSEGAQQGLLTSAGAPVPLVGVRIEAVMRDLAVRTVLVQRFRNVERTPVEALYSFPLEEGSAVCGFEVRIGGRLVRGRVEEREKAFEQYDEAMAAGHGAFLMDQHRPDVFTVSAGRLEPGAEAEVRITQVSRAESYDRGLRLRIPTTISPRYVPAEMLAKGDPAGLDAILPPTSAAGVPYGLTLAVDVSAGSAIRAVACPSHPVESRVKGRRATVTLMGRDVQLDSDFVLDIELEKPSEPRAVACRDGEGFALMIRLKPVLPAESSAPRDVVFVVDRSGSMEGESIAEARAALLLGLKSLREGDRFEVIGFGTGPEPLFGRLTECTEEYVERAVAATSSWRADLGGTEILRPMEAALGCLEEGRAACILLLTDGQVGNEGEVIDLVRRHRDRCRVFSFGIGRGVGATLVRGVARASGGSCEFIHPGERIEPRVMRQVARMRGAFRTGARIDWGSLEPGVVTPAELPSFCQGDEIVAFARLEKPGRATVRLLAGDGTLAGLPVSLSAEGLENDDTIALLMARSLIADLESGGFDGNGSAQAARKAGSREGRILGIALRYGLVSSQTSFVAVEEREDADPSVPVQLRRVPVALTRGWGGSSAMMMPCMAPAPLGIASRLASYAQKRTSICLPCSLQSSIDGPSRRPRRQKRAESPVDRLLALVALQRIDGSWKLDDRLAALAGMRKADIAKASKAAGEVPATLAALYVFWTEFGEREDEWRLIVDKALAWLAERGVTPSRPAPGLDLAVWLAQGGAGPA